MVSDMLQKAAYSVEIKQDDLGLINSLTAKEGLFFNAQKPDFVTLSRDGEQIASIAFGADAKGQYAYVAPDGGESSMVRADHLFSVLETAIYRFANTHEQMQYQDAKDTYLSQRTLYPTAYDLA